MLAAALTRGAVGRVTRDLERLAAPDGHFALEPRGRVGDEGVGIPHAEQERIFRKFYRGDAASAGAVGAGAAGLGLFLAEGLVTAMGGRIRVDSGEGRGSTFVLELRPAESGT